MSAVLFRSHRATCVIIVIGTIAALGALAFILAVLGLGPPDLRIQAIKTGLLFLLIAGVWVTVSPRQWHTYRHAPVVVAAIVLVVLLMTTAILISGKAPITGPLSNALQISLGSERFGDLKAILRSSECFRSKLLGHESDCSDGLLAYGPGIRLFGLLPANIGGEFVGSILGFLGVVIMALIVWKTASLAPGPGPAAALLAGLSFAVFLLVERANLDLLMIALILFPLSWALQNSSLPKWILAAGAILVASSMKFFPLAALSALIFFRSNEICIASCRRHRGDGRASGCGLPERLQGKRIKQRTLLRSRSLVARCRS